jgi:hypothetical protein
MRSHPGLNRTLLGLALAAGLAWLAPSPAHAQFTYGYGSVVTYPQSAQYWYGAGYSGVYTDTSTGVFVPGSEAQFRGVAPYAQPPYNQYGSSNGLAAATARTARTARTAPATTAPTRPTVVPQRRRGLLGRMFRR